MPDRLFSEEALKQVVQRHLEDVPIGEGERGKFLTVGNKDGIKAVIAVRMADGWSVGGFVDVERKPDDHWGTDYGVIVRGTF